jgi:hypothetical protein
VSMKRASLQRVEIGICNENRIIKSLFGGRFIIFPQAIVQCWAAIRGTCTRLQASPSLDQHQTRTVPNQQLAPKDEDRARNGSSSILQRLSVFGRYDRNEHIPFQPLDGSEHLFAGPSREKAVLRRALSSPPDPWLRPASYLARAHERYGVLS